MSEFAEAYKLLLLKQYYNKDNASAEVEAIVSGWERIFEFVKEFYVEWDVGTATGDRLDKIGKLVGVNRIVPFVLEKIRFGFDGDETARGFGYIFDESVESAPFASIYEQPYTTQQLDDNDYRFFIKAKIAVNWASAYMVSDDRISIQDTVEQVFNGEAFVLDNQDMTLTLYVGSGIDADRLRLIRRLNLLPKPQGVRYKFVGISSDNAFGFADDPNALGFGSLYDSSVGGSLATLIL